MKFPHSVVVGKFLPPHKGHHFLINTALERSEKATVIVCEKPSDPIPGPLRQAWLQEIHPSAEIMLIDDRYDENDSRIWAENTIRWLGHAPDAVFTSEDYGDTYAHHLGCTHIQVDKARGIVPCSGTAIRQDPFAKWEFLEGPARAWFAKRICVLGAESTGTTTLASALAEAVETNWVAEYGREYSAAKAASGDSIWTTEEFELIAKEQQRREDMAARDANRILICDTNSFATTLWHRRYMGFASPSLAEFATTNVRCDLYVLTGDEIPFVQDGLRDGEHVRHEMHEWFKAALQQQQTPWVLVRGTVAERLEQAKMAISGLFANSLWKLTASAQGAEVHSTRR